MNKVISTMAAAMATLSSTQSYNLPSYTKPQKGKMDIKTRRRRNKNRVASASRKRNRK